MSAGSNVWMNSVTREYGHGYYCMDYTIYTPTEYYVVDDFGNLVQVY